MTAPSWLETALTVHINWCWLPPACFSGSMSIGFESWSAETGLQVIYEAFSICTSAIKSRLQIHLHALCGRGVLGKDLVNLKCINARIKSQFQLFDDK